MRVVPFLISSVLTIVLIVALSVQWGSVPPLGNFLSPQHGLWKNAEDVEKSFQTDLSFPNLKGKVEVFLDERMVPHVFAEHERDLFFVQGWLHARFRLWQMEFQTYAAAGRISEILGAGAGNRYLNYDRSMRRLGMGYAAERSLQAAENNPISKMQYEAYAEGINAYIDELKPADYPIEYKLLNYQPEKWTPLKTALFLKYMSYDLAGKDDDFEFTNLRTIFSRADFEMLFPVYADSLKPIAPSSAENPYPSKPAMDLHPPAHVDSAYFGFRDDSITSSLLNKPNRDNGSNNWAVAGSKTKSGRPIICNDPHLGLNLPSLWFEMQLSTPDFSCYGVSFPGSPNIIIGFNDYIGWAVTNAGRDVKDYYELKFKNAASKEYWYNGEWKATTTRIDTILIKGGAPLYDTIQFTDFGPVMYDGHFKVDSGSLKFLAVRWKAHDPSNEGFTFYGLNHARNYDDYLAAIKNFTCPAQNFLFASKSGDIAIWQQGEFPAKWRRQGDFIMPGTDSSYLWKGIIPQQQNPHLVNPSRGFCSSANQAATDSTYPYYLGNIFPVYRGYIINRKLSRMENITTDDMKAMQTDNYNVKAEFGRDILLKTPVDRLNEDERKYLQIFRMWTLRNDPAERGATIYSLWWRELEYAIWHDDFEKTKLPVSWPAENVLVESLHRDSTYKFIDDITTPERETLQDQLVASLKTVTGKLKQLEKEGKLEWGKFKDTKVQHLLRQTALSRLHLPIGGGAGVINATKEDHGPSWRMVVQLTDDIEAWGVYPGGQSGNPGSKYYDNFVDSWAAGKYYRLWIMKESEQNDKRVVGRFTFSK
jgi:penicillin amidase